MWYLILKVWLALGCVSLVFSLWLGPEFKWKDLTRYDYLFFLCIILSGPIALILLALYAFH